MCTTQAQVKNFKDYIQKYLKSAPSHDREDLTKRLVFEWVSEQWEVGFIPSSLEQLQQVSFFSSISTSKGGTHINYVVDAIKKLKSKILPENITLKPASFGDSAKALDYYGMFPFCGKLLNMWDARSAQVKGNKELINICKIMGLNNKVDNLDTSKLQYGHLMIMTDQDHDGSHIKGLLNNFFDYFYPSLLTVDDFMQEFITPIIKSISKNQQHGTIQFFTIPDTYIKYYKGLAMPIGERFEPMQDDECQIINLTFSKKKANAHKEWLSQFCPGTYIDQSGNSITHTDFNEGLIHFSIADIFSILSVVDSLKPGQCKGMYGCFLQSDAEVKVAMLTGSIIKKVVYHHGDQKFYGANNVKMLAHLSQLGSCTQGDKDAGAVHYISTHLKPINQLLFHKDDIPLLNYLDDDGIKMEPDYNLVDVESPIPMLPWYLEFTSNIKPSSHNHYTVCGHITKLNDQHFEIMELPIRCLNSNITEDYEKHYSNLGMRYIVWVSEASMVKQEKEDQSDKFRLMDSIFTSNLVCFDKSGRIKCYASAEEILTEFNNICLQFYHKHKEYLVSKCIQEYTKLSNQACFILAFINEELGMCNIIHADFIRWLSEMAFDPINTKNDDGATNSSFKYLLGMKMINMTRELVEKLVRFCAINFEEIEVLHAKSSLDLWNADLDFLLKLWEDTVEENQLAFSQSLTEGTSCSNKKRWRVAPKPKLKKESKETNPKGLAHSDRTS
ncbi:DNA topoisomerase 2 [Massospora cicadina]|nr:DNA topoisomerase 2 [Massospora cicadina]